MGDTENFLRLLNESNARIAAMEAERQAVKGLDEVRLQREQERREKWGQLRAREHQRSRHYQVNNVFGHNNPT
jgi:hypothetical protein